MPLCSAAGVLLKEDGSPTYTGGDHRVPMTWQEFARVSHLNVIAVVVPCIGRNVEQRCRATWFHMRFVLVCLQCALHISRGIIGFYKLECSRRMPRILANIAIDFRWVMLWNLVGCEVFVGVLQRQGDSRTSSRIWRFMLVPFKGQPTYWLMRFSWGVRISSFLVLIFLWRR